MGTRRTGRARRGGGTAVARRLLCAVATAAAGCACAVLPAAALVAAHGHGPAATPGRLSVRAAPTPAGVAALSPGAAGGVTVRITNPNPFPVTVTALELPADDAYAVGFATAALRVPVAGCGASADGSDVTWRLASVAAGSRHVLVAPLTVAGAGGAPLTVTFVAGAWMGPAASPVCEGAYFAMPPLTGVVAAGTGRAPTPGPATDAWR